MLFHKLFFRTCSLKQSKASITTITPDLTMGAKDKIIRRAMLYVPGNQPKRMEKASLLKVDSIILDCEDGVAQNQKVVARENIKQFLDGVLGNRKEPELTVRINPVFERELCEGDIEAVLSAKTLPSSICLPKVSHVDQLQWFSEQVWRALIKRPENDRGPINLLMYIESALAFINLPELCRKAEDLSTMVPIVPAGLIFGCDDFIASIGATKSTSGVEVFYARQKLVLVAKAFGLQAIDMVNINYQNPKQLEIECSEGVQMGYTGKQVIHPNQVTITQDLFVPSVSKIKWAKNVVRAFQKYQDQGQGAFTFEDAMIDMPSYRQALNILAVAKAAGKLVETPENPSN